MDKDIMVHISGVQYSFAGEEPEPVEVITPGKYYFKNGHHYIVYDEPGDEAGEVCHNLLKFRKSYLEVTKSGYISTKLLFEESKKTKTIYQTPMGTLNIGVATTLVDLDEKRDEIGLTANYVIDINDSFVSDCSFSLRASSKERGLELTS